MVLTLSPYFLAYCFVFIGSQHGRDMSVNATILIYSFFLIFNPILLIFISRYYVIKYDVELVLSIMMCIISGFGSILFVHWYWWYKSGAYTTSHYDPKASFYPYIIAIELFIVAVVFIVGLLFLKSLNNAEKDDATAS